MKKKILIPFFAFILTSCTTYKEYNEDDFQNFTWEPGQVIEFKPNIESISESYRLGLGIRHVYGLANSNLSITVRSVAPSGAISFGHYDLKIKDTDGDYVSSCAGDMCDLETFVNEEFWFKEKGTHTFLLSLNGKSPVAGVMAMGLLLDEN